MPESPYKSTNCEIRRYFVPSSLLASQTTKSTAQVRKRKMKPELLTYIKLIESQQKLVNVGQLNPRTFANRATALRHFMRANHVQNDDVVGMEMRPHYPLALGRLVELLRSEDRGDRDVSNTKAAVSPWKLLVVEHDNQVAYALDAPTPFRELVKSCTTGLSLVKLSREAGIPVDMVTGWLKGKNPRLSNIGYLRRFESFFGLERDSLVSLTGFSNAMKARVVAGLPVQVDFRKHQRERVKDTYYIKVPPTSPLRAQWLDFMKYKTAPAPLLERGGRARWTFSALTSKLETPHLWHCFQDGLYVPTAKATYTKIASYLGWLSLPTEEGGMGLPEESTHTLAWLAVPDFIEKYLDWMKKRSAGARTTSAIQFLATVGSLTRTDGYLSQQDWFLKTLPQQYHDQNWGSLCQKQWRYSVRLMNAFTPEVTHSRDSFAPIRHILDLPQPMEAIADMICRMRAERPISCASLEAIWARDLFLVKLMVSNPLRLSNIACLEWRIDNVDGNHPRDKCSLYQRTDKSWWIFIPKACLKNRGGKLTKYYDSPVHETVWKGLERYVLKHRNVLLQWPSDLVFISRGRNIEREARVKGGRYKKPPQTCHRPFMELSGRLFALTRMYLWKCDGIHSHAFRHIVATSILKTDGGDIKTAALVLHDCEATVQKHYSGMQSGDGAKRMGVLLGSTFARM